jgi:hypothetical protein
MLFAQKLLTPEPQPRHPGNVNPATGGPPGRAGVYPKIIMTKIIMALNFRSFCAKLSLIFDPQRGGTCKEYGLIIGALAGRFFS